MTPEDPFRAEASAVAEDITAATLFLTRVPPGWIGAAPAERPDFRRGARVFPVIGGLVGAFGGAVFVVAAFLGTPPLISAALAILAIMVATGGLHEDGLSDTVDAFGGGTTAARKLEIMDDSRIGALGAAALIFSILLRVAALASLGSIWPFRAALALVAAEAVSRAALVRLWQELPAARLGGLAHETGPPDQQAMLIALAVALVIALATVWPSSGFFAAVVGILLSIAATYIFTRISNHEIGGRTGDTLGACQQIAAIAFLVGVAAAA